MTPYLTLHPHDLTFHGSTDRLHKNIAALRLPQTLATEQRPATRAEQVTLAHYTAFGESDLLRRLFPYDDTTGRYAVAEAYADLLSEADGKHLRRAALTAYYTPLDLIQVLWQAVAQLGLATLEQPRILEPAAGVGHMISMMPPELRARAAITLVELDPVTVRTIDDTDATVLSAAEIKAQATDNPQIIRKVQLEQEVSRLTRLRQVHHETLKRLRQDQQFTTQALHERRQRVTIWTTAQTLVASHPSAPFRAQVATRLGQDTPFQSYDQRTAAGQALRDRVNQAVTAAQFQAAPVYQTIAYYRGGHLTLMAEPRGAATVRLTLPDGACLDTVTVQTDVGVWASCDKLLQSVASRHQQAQDAVQESAQRLESLARELARSTVWSGQTAYDAAQAELVALDAELTQATEETTTAERPAATEMELRTWLTLDALPPDAPLPAITLPPITHWPDQYPVDVEVLEPVKTVTAAGLMEETTDPVVPAPDRPTPTRPPATNQPDGDAFARPTRPRRNAPAVPEGQHSFLDLIA